MYFGGLCLRIFLTGSSASSCCEVNSFTLACPPFPPQCSASTQAHGDRATVYGNLKLQAQRCVTAMKSIVNEWSSSLTTVPDGIRSVAAQAATWSWESALQIRLLCPHCYEEGRWCGHKGVLCFRD